MKRRHFIKSAASGVVLPAILNGFGIKAFAQSSVFDSLAGQSVLNDRVLVLIQLAGGNDGLSTLVPIDQYANLANARSNIILPQSQLLNLSGQPTLKLHPSMTGIRRLFDEGKAAFVQSVGYPDQDLSHFRSTDIWMSASGASTTLNSGWAGRYLQYEYPNFPVGFPNTTMPDPLAIEIGFTPTLTLTGQQTGMGMTIGSETDFYNLIQGVQDPAPNTNAGQKLEYIRFVASQTRQYATVIQAAATRIPTQSPYPANNELAAKLKIVARLVAGGLKTKVYTVSLSGFDTHDSQVDASNRALGEHPALLTQLSEAVTAFMDDLYGLGVQDRVLAITHSEFGRRIASNASLGTDHGAAAPMFIFGSKVNPGVIGNNPVIPFNVTPDENVPMQYDYRQVYSTVLRDWFCVPSNDLGQILNTTFGSLPFISPSASCTPTSIHEANVTAGDFLLEATPNPFQREVNIKFKTNGGHTLVQILDMNGRVVGTPVNDQYQAGTYTTVWDSADLPGGIYYCKIQNHTLQQVKSMVKAL